MTITRNYHPAEALDKVPGVSDEGRREAYVDRFEVVNVKFEFQTLEAYRCFGRLDQDLLPRLPDRYLWVFLEDEETEIKSWAVVKDRTAADHSLHVVIYGPDDDGDVNYIYIEDNVTKHGFAHTRSVEEDELKRKYPVRYAGYKVPGYQYRGHKYKAHVRGHVVDHRDTIRETGIRDVWSTFDARNYVPEPPDYHWGMGMRRQLVAEIRDKNRGVAYSQFMEYGDPDLKTKDGTPVPSAIYFRAYDLVHGKYVVNKAFNFGWEEDLSRPDGVKYLDHAAETIATGVDACPDVACYSPGMDARTIRRLRRDSERKVRMLQGGTIKSRAPERDATYAQINAADHEVVGINNGLGLFHMAFGNDEHDLGFGYLAKSLDFGEQQAELDDEEDVVEKKMFASAVRLFKDYDGEEDLDDYEDRLRKLYGDQRATRRF